ncbi:hypothetical protein [Enterococcus bulliens]
MHKLVGVIHFVIFVVLLAAILLLMSSVFIYHKYRLFIISNGLLIVAVLYNWYLFSRLAKKIK